MSTELTREQVNQMQGPVLLEFGATWCPHCQALRPAVRELLKRHPEIRHILVEDGRGKPLGRSFRVKLWPNFVLLHEGRPVAQLARPTETELFAKVENHLQPAAQPEGSAR